MYEILVIECPIYNNFNKKGVKSIKNVRLFTFNTFHNL